MLSSNFCRRGSGCEVVQVLDGAMESDDDLLVLYEEPV